MRTATAVANVVSHLWCTHTVFALPLPSILYCETPQGRYPNTAVYQYKSTLDEYCDSDRNGKHHCKYVLHIPLLKFNSLQFSDCIVLGLCVRLLYAATLSCGCMYDLIAVSMDCTHSSSDW
jgi:hypothetical protein